MRRPTLGTLCLVVMGVFAMCDLAARSLPAAWFSFRAWEAVTLDPALGAPFAAGARYRNERAFGDLAVFSNRRRLAVARPETFTSDPYGFRRNPSLAGLGPPKTLLIGDSFAAGAGLSDEETLASQLGVRGGLAVYNAAGIPPGASWIGPLADRLGVGRGVVIHALVERSFPTKAGRSPLVDGVLRTLARRWRFSPLEILARRAYRRGLDDRLLPNVLAAQAVVARFHGGREILVLPEDIEIARQHRETGAAVRYWQEMNAALAARKLKLVVVLIPTKYTVYRDLLESPRVDVEAGRPFVDRLAEDIRHDGIVVVNLRAAFEAAARRLLSRGEDLYWPDDSHWNAEGVRVAADETARAVARLVP